LVARMVFYAARVVTIRQREFNRHLLEAVRLIAQEKGHFFTGGAKTLIGGEALEERTKRELQEFLNSDEGIEFPPVLDPEVSVLLVVYNRAELTLNCLRSLLRSTFRSFEVIIVNNASSDETDQLLKKVRGVQIIPNSENAHFLQGSNQAAAAASGQNLLFLNNDTQLDPGAIEAAMKTLNELPNAGAVGARLIHKSGLLQEAGCIVWNSGSCRGFGRGESPDSAAFVFRRLTDFVSGAFLLTPRALFESVGRFDLRFMPAYCEDVDYCLSLWKIGKQVVYEPDSLVMHLERASSETSVIATELMKRNQDKLREKHGTWLAANHFTDDRANVTRAAFARYPGKRILFLEDRIPRPEFGSGFPRSQSIVRHLADDGNFVTCYPLRFVDESASTAQSALGRDIEVVPMSGLAGLPGFLQKRMGTYNVLWISRPHNLEFVEGLRKSRPELFSGVRIVYDAEAIFCIREIERVRTLGNEIRPKDFEKRICDELAPARSCDAVAVTSNGEKGWCERLGIRNVQVLSAKFNPSTQSPPFAARNGFLFVGPVLEDVCPNADAVERLVCHIFPKLKKIMGSKAQLLLIGYQSSYRLRALIRDCEDPGILCMGQVADIEQYFHQARVFVAPTRFSAGIPNKILEAAAHGSPVVATSLLASQLGWESGCELLIADSDEEIAEACARLHDDEELWLSLRDGALRRIYRDYNPAVFSKALRLLLGYPA
jgi:GT2 family glycosyltransferase